MASGVIPIAEEKAKRLPKHSALPALLPIAVAVVSSVSLLLLFQTSGVTTTGYDVRRLEQERDDWQQQNYQLEAAIAGLQSLDRIEKEARGRLQMVPAADYIFVTVREIPLSSPREIAPPAHSKKSDLRSEDGGWSQRLLDWVGTALGFR